MDERPNQAEASGASSPEALATPIAILRPLAVSGLVVGTAALVAALRPYLPRLVAIEPLDGGRFLLTLAAAGPGGDDVAD